MVALLNQCFDNYSNSSSNDKDTTIVNNNDSSDVVVLTDNNFKELVENSNDHWFIELYAPWCGHCKNLAPEWEKLATQLKGKVKVGKVDATVESSLKERFNVNGFPTLKLLKADST